MRYWHTTHGAEVDLVDLVIEELLVGIEIKASMSKQVRSLRSFMKRYDAGGVVMSSRWGRKEILHYPYWLL